MAGGTRTVTVVIHGLVQGVGYRMWTQRAASRHGLSGHVRNRADGTVEALFSGEAEPVAAMIVACRAGPPGARVTGLDVTEREGPAPMPGFPILRP